MDDLVDVVGIKKIFILDQDERVEKRIEEEEKTLITLIHKDSLIMVL